MRTDYLGVSLMVLATGLITGTLLVGSMIALDSEHTGLSGFSVREGPVRIDPGEGVFERLEYRDTYSPGTYLVEVVATYPNGSREVIHSGRVHVVDPERTGTVLDIAFVPSRVQYGESARLAITLTTDTDVSTIVGMIRHESETPPFIEGEGARNLAFTEASSVQGTVFSATIRGDVQQSLQEGTWILEESHLLFRDAQGRRLEISLPEDLPTLEIVGSVECTSSDDCGPDEPYCVWADQGFRCSNRCASEGSRASDEDSCCVQLAHLPGINTCYMPGDRFTFVFVPLGYSEERLNEYRRDVERIVQAISTRLPIRECTSERAGFHYVRVDALDCIEACTYQFDAMTPAAQDSLNDLLRQELENCKQEALECAQRHVEPGTRIDRVVGLSVEHWYANVPGMRTGQTRRVGLALGVSDLPGRRSITAIDQLTGRVEPDLVLHEIGHGFGLYHLSCSVNENLPGGACSGPNHHDCQPSCTSPIQLSCTDTTQESSCSEEEIIRCLSDTRYNEGLLMSYCRNTDSEYGLSGYDHIRSQNDLRSALVNCGAI